MFCPTCGNGITAGAHFCQRCGAQVLNAAPPAQFPGYAAPPQYVPVPQPPRVKQHQPTLGILWCVYIVLRFLGLVWALVFLRMFLVGIFAPHSGMDQDVMEMLRMFHDFIARLIPIILGVSVSFLILYAVATYGLLTRKPWGRVVMIAAAIPILLGFPLGTALGIYTLWVLAPSTSGSEYEALMGNG